MYLPGRKVIKPFFLLISAGPEIFFANKYENAMPTIVDIFIFISWERFMLSYV